MTEKKCQFCEIARAVVSGRQEPVASNRRVFVIEDANPKAATHLLVMPFAHLESLADADSDAILAVHQMIQRVARERELDGYRLIVNVGEAGKQKVPHLHFHLLAGPEVLEPGFARGVE